MTERELLELILSKVNGIETRMDRIEAKIESMETRMDAIETRLKQLEAEVSAVQEKIGSMEERISKMEASFAEMQAELLRLRLHLENATDKNILLLAENHTHLVKKLNQAIPAADKNLLYEVKMNCLMQDVENLKQEIEKLKKTAS